MLHTVFAEYALCGRSIFEGVKNLDKVSYTCGLNERSKVFNVATTRVFLKNKK